MFSSHRILEVDADGVVGWQDAASQVVRLDAGGNTMASLSVTVTEATDPATVWSPGWGRAVYLDPAGARVVAASWDAIAP